MLLQYFPEYVTIKKFLDVTLVPDLESLSPQFRNLFALDPSHGFCCQQYVYVSQSKVAIVRVKYCSWMDSHLSKVRGTPF